jgi:hypothetical protein
VVENVLARLEDPLREPVFAHELPDVFLRVQFGTFRRLPDQRDVWRDGEAAGEVPTGLVDDERGVGAERNLGDDFNQTEVHRLAVAARHEEGRACGPSLERFAAALIIEAS